MDGAGIVVVADQRDALLGVGVFQPQEWCPQLCCLVGPQQGAGLLLGSPHQRLSLLRLSNQFIDLVNPVVLAAGEQAVLTMQK